MDPKYTPADRLEGVTLDSGWIVGPSIPRPKGSTGGNFGTCYLAERGGERAFLKAIDFRRAFLQEDVLSALNQLTNHVLWERGLLEFCRDAKMSRVVTLLDYQEILLPQDGDDPTKKVSCLLFEVGEGDLRAQFKFEDSPSLGWRLSVLRDIALGLDQLHRRGIAHLDLKPSNVIGVTASGSSIENKLADLGRSVRQGSVGPFDGQSWPGDPGYMPPEKWYGYRSGQWHDERYAPDAYLLGSIFTYLFCGLPMNVLLQSEMPEQFRPGIYTGGWDQQLVDVLRHAQTTAITLHVERELPACSKDELMQILLSLTDPDPTIRGDAKARRSNQIGLDRYHQKLLRVSRRVLFEETRNQ